VPGTLTVNVAAALWLAEKVCEPVAIPDVAIVKVASLTPISDRLHATFALPLTDLTVAPIVKVLAVPQLAVVIAAVPLKLVPLIALAVCSAVAVEALPVKGPVKLPVTVLLVSVCVSVVPTTTPLGIAF
jgi:hypothetical protein